MGEWPPALAPVMQIRVKGELSGNSFENSGDITGLSFIHCLQGPEDEMAPNYRQAGRSRIAMLPPWSYGIDSISFIAFDRGCVGTGAVTTKVTPFPSNTTVPPCLNPYLHELLPLNVNAHLTKSFITCCRQKAEARTLSSSSLPCSLTGNPCILVSYE